MGRRAETALGQEPSHLSFLVDTGQVSVPPWSSVFPSVKWQDQVAASTGLGTWNQGQLRRPMKLLRTPHLFQDGSLKILHVL